MKTFLSEIIIAVLLIVLASLLWNPYWMPMGVFYTVLTFFIVLFGGFVAFIWREKGGDERDVLIRHIASRFAYLTVSAIMALGIIYEAMTRHAVDPWLTTAFIVAILGKTIGFVYGKGRY